MILHIARIDSSEKFANRYFRLEMLHTCIIMVLEAIFYNSHTMTVHL